MSTSIGYSAKWMRCNASGLQRGLITCIAASALLSCANASVVRAQAPEAGKPTQSAAPVDPSAGARNQKSDDKPVGNVSDVQKKLAEDKAKLLKLATELKNEIDKAGTVALSAAAIRRVDEIEKLARSIRQEMNRDPGKAH